MDINGGSTSRRRAVGSADMYRHVPKEMTEATKLGVIMSLVSVITMFVLFFCETYAFASTKITSSVEVDENSEQLIRLNFNITLYDLHCDLVSVDVWDSLGTNLQNITKDITKWNLDMHGQKKKFAGRNAEIRPVQHEEHKETMQELSDSVGGDMAVMDLDPEKLGKFLETFHDQAFIDFYAPWCIWCQRLAPTWEKFAREIKAQGINVGVGTVDCVANPQMCKDQRIMAFPTLRWYENGKAAMPDYRGDRTVDALMEYVKKRGKNIERKKQEEQGVISKDKYTANEFSEFEEEHHPGCLVAGHLMVNRVPGNFHMEARSVNHEINAAMTNLTHRVNDLSFGSTDPTSGHVLHMINHFSNVPEKFKHTNPMKDKFYPTYEYHEAWHHHMKVVSTHIDYLFSRGTVLYQILENSQVVYYPEESVPEIKFRFDMSPMSVNLTKEGRRWYEYLTSLFAIIGGTYTTLGLINATLLRIFKPKKI